MARGSCPVTKARNEGPPSGPPVVAAQGWLTSPATQTSPAPTGGCAVRLSTLGLDGTRETPRPAAMRANTLARGYDGDHEAAPAPHRTASINEWQPRQLPGLPFVDRRRSVGCRRSLVVTVVASR